jgi:hypothetical protein
MGGRPGAAGPGGGQSSESALRDEFAFEFGKGSEDAEYQLPGGRRSVHGGLAVEDFQADAAFRPGQEVAPKASSGLGERHERSEPLGPIDTPPER